MNSPSYQRPAPALARAVEASHRHSFSLAPTGDRWVLTEYSVLLQLRDLAEPELRLAGLRFNPGSRVSNRDLYYCGLRFQQLDGDIRDIVGLPNSPRLVNLSWSPDSRWLAFTHNGEQGLELWLADFETARARRLQTPPLNQVHGGACFRWLRDSTGLIVLAIAPEGEVPRPPVLPSSPLIHDHGGSKAPTRTYQDLLKTPHDEELFAYYLQSQLFLVQVEGEIRPFLGPRLLTQFSLSPGGQHLLVQELLQPFSYHVPYQRFASRTQVFDLQGQWLQTVAELPVCESIPPDFDAARPGRRYVGWREDQPSTLVWLEALDEGDPHRPAEIRDQLVQQPLGGDPAVLLACAGRLEALYWGDGETAIFQEGWWRNRRRRCWRVRPNGSAPPSLLFDYSSEDDYQNPGRPLTQSDSSGLQLLQRDPETGALFLVGQGATPEGERPFLDRFHLDSGKSERLFQSEPPYFETPLRVLSSQRLLTQRETQVEPPNLGMRHLGSNQIQALTSIEAPLPELTRIRKELLRYRRQDGVELTATLYLPPEHQGEPLPVLMWAYPSEYKSAAMAGQLRDSACRYVHPSWSGPLFFALHGYAVLDDPTFPIVGEGEAEPNDTYLEQLLQSAHAAIDLLVDRGVGDRQRMAIGGHSYGAFTAANLLAHSRLFRAGIARSGAFNRSLTPFGFQSEERTYWQAKSTYIEMSPFHHADKIQDPLLLIHGAEDSNSGTFPLQSERMYQALRGLGATTRLVLLPLEDHSYRAQESVLHCLWEMQQWLDTHVKGPKG